MRIDSDLFPGLRGPCTPATERYHRSDSEQEAAADDSEQETAVDELSKLVLVSSEPRGVFSGTVSDHVRGAEYPRGGIVKFWD